MCGPALPFVAGAAALISAGGHLYAGAAAKQQGNYEKQVADMNAQADRASATDASRRGEIEQQRRYRMLAQQLGGERAKQGAYGLDLGFGTALETQDAITAIGNEDISTIAENTRREMMGFDINAANQTMKGRAAKARGNAAFVSGVFNAGGSILGGAQQIGGMYAPGGSQYRG